jgi:NADPH:quinone reductase-like Zn-dependent oxidoreductase
VVAQGTGSVSLFALQFASAIGAEVIVTTTSEAKAEQVRALGARHFVNRSEAPDWAGAVMALTAERGADHILEIGGGANLGKSVVALAPGGRISLIGVIAGFESSFPSVPAIHAFAVIQAVFVGHRHGLENMVRSIEANRLSPVIDTVFGFAEFPVALERLGQGPFGKVVVRV